MSTTNEPECSADFLRQLRMEARQSSSSPILTLTLSPQTSSDNDFDPQSSIDSSGDFVVANTPPYSPMASGRSSFTFFPQPSPVMPGRRRQPGLSRLFVNYVKYFLAFGVFFTCLLLLEQSPQEAVQYSNSVDESRPASRLRRALSVASAPEAGIVKDGPLFDLGDGYSASKGEDVLITVKTSKKYHVSRLDDILDTWFRLAPEQIYFITDVDDGEVNARTGGRLIPTACLAGHNRKALCCKQSMEYETYLKHSKSWWCHFDDDNYVNVPQLMRTLSQYDPRQDWYLGKPSTKGPIETPFREYAPNDFLESNEKISFWFATGGAGFCISKSLAMKMRPYAADGKFEALCDRIRLPDDVSIGYLVEVLLEKNLTVVPRFHSHLENMRAIDPDQLHEQVTLSAGSYDGRDLNLVNVDRFFPDAEDPRRFRSLHCHLYPMAAVCRSRKVVDAK